MHETLPTRYLGTLDGGRAGAPEPSSICRRSAFKLFAGYIQFASSFSSTQKTTRQLFTQQHRSQRP